MRSMNFSYPLVRKSIGVLFTLGGCLTHLWSFGKYWYAHIPNIDTFVIQRKKQKLYLLISPPEKFLLESCQSHDVNASFTKFEFFLFESLNVIIGCKHYQLFFLRNDRLALFIFKKMSIKYTSLNNYSLAAVVPHKNYVLCKKLASLVYNSVVQMLFLQISIFTSVMFLMLYAFFSFHHIGY